MSTIRHAGIHRCTSISGKAFLWLSSSPWPRGIDGSVIRDATDQVDHWPASARDVGFAGTVAYWAYGAMDKE